MQRARRKREEIQWGDSKMMPVGGRRQRGRRRNYFSNLFRSSNIDGASQQLLDAVVPSVTEEMNEQLCRPFSAEEVKSALDSIGDLKAPGPDGMPSIFYKIVGIWWETKLQLRFLMYWLEGISHKVGMTPQLLSYQRSKILSR